MLLGLLLPQPGRCFEAAASFAWTEWPHVFVDGQWNGLAPHLWKGTLSAPAVKPLACNTTERTEMSLLRPTANRGRNKYVFLVMAWEVSWGCGWDGKSEEGILYKVLTLRRAVGRNVLAVEMPQLWYEIFSHLNGCIRCIRLFPFGYRFFLSLR